jgi:biotin transport system substrate-specific component
MTNRDVVYCALFAAIVAVLGLIPPVPLPIVPVPITAQSLGVMLAGSILGARRGGLALVLFLILVAIGLPVLAGGRGGVGVFLSPSGGFLIAFPLAAFTIGWLTERLWQRLNVGTALLCNILGGIGVVYLLGIPWLAIAASLSLPQAIAGSAVFIPGDLIKAGLAAMAAVAVKRSYPLIEPEHGRHQRL